MRTVLPKVALGCLVASLVTMGAALVAQERVVDSVKPGHGALPIASKTAPALDFQLPSGPRVARAERLEFVIQIDSKPYLSETISIAAGSAPGRTFGLLAERPELRAELYGLVESGGQEASVALKVGGREVAASSLRELFRADGSPSLPLRYERSDVRMLAGSRLDSGFGRFINQTAASCDPACYSVCDQQYQDCPAQECPGEDWCPQCDSDYQSCLDGCRYAVSSSDHDVYRVTADNAYGYACLYPYGGATYAYTYRLHQRTIEHDVYRYTTYCDGSSSDTFLYYVGTSTQYCDTQVNWNACGNPGGTLGSNDLCN
jgi:hypothetical protein